MEFADYVSDRKVKLSPTLHGTLLYRRMSIAQLYSIARPHAASCLVPPQSCNPWTITSQHSAVGRVLARGRSATRASVQHGVQTSEVERVAKPVQKVHPELCSRVCVVVCPLWRRCVIVNWLSSLWHQVSSIRYERLHKLNTSIVNFVTNVRVSPLKNENVKGLYPRVLWFLDCFMCEMRDVCEWMMRVNGIANFSCTGLRFIYLFDLDYDNPRATHRHMHHVTTRDFR